MSEGVIETLQAEVEALREALRRVCGRAGHVFSADWQQCGERRHEPRHTERCDLCGAFKCEVGS